MAKELFEAMASVLQLDATERESFLAALKDGDNYLDSTKAADVVLEKGKARVTKLKDDQYKRGEREVTESFIAGFKALGFEPKGGDKKTMVQEFAATIKGKDIDDETIIKHSAFARLLNEKVAASQTAAATIKKEYEDYKATMEASFLKTKIEAATATAMEEHKIVLEQPALGVKKQDRLATIASLIPVTDVIEVEGVLYMKEGDSVKKDNFGTPVKYTDFIGKKAAALYGVSTGQTGKGAPNPTGKEGEGGGGKYKFADAADYSNQLDKATKEQRIEIMEAWAAQADQVT